jgi:hypothetical protein
MEKLDDFVERLRLDVEKRTNCFLSLSEKQTFGGYTLRKTNASGKGNFAIITYVGEKVKKLPKNCFEIEVAQKHAIKAGVTGVEDRETDNGWYGDPAYYYWVPNKERQAYIKLVEILSKISKVR